MGEAEGSMERVERAREGGEGGSDDAEVVFWEEMRIGRGRGDDGEGRREVEAEEVELELEEGGL